MNPDQITGANGTGRPDEIAAPPVDSPTGARGDAGGTGEAIDTQLPPARWEPETMRTFAIAMLAIVCLAWALLAIPRAQELAGLSGQTGTGAKTRGSGDTATEEVGGGDEEMVVVLAAISIAVVLAAAGARAFVFSMVQEAIDEENEDTQRYVDDAEEAEGAANAARYEADQLTAKIDATPERVEAEVAIQETQFWEAHHLRAHRRPDIHGDWESEEDRTEAAQRTIKALWGPASVPSKEEIETLIGALRTKTERDIAAPRAEPGQDS